MQVFGNNEILVCNEFHQWCCPGLQAVQKVLSTSIWLVVREMKTSTIAIKMVWWISSKNTACAEIIAILNWMAVKEAYQFGIINAWKQHVHHSFLNEVKKEMKKCSRCKRTEGMKLIVLVIVLFLRHMLKQCNGKIRPSQQILIFMHKNFH